MVETVEENENFTEKTKYDMDNKLNGIDSDLGKLRKFIGHPDVSRKCNNSAKINHPAITAYVPLGKLQ